MDPATPGEIAARLRAYHATANPDVLWPEVTRSARLAALQRITGVTREVLRGAVPFLACSDEEREPLGIAAFTSGTGPLFGLWIRQGAVRATPATADLLAEHLEHARRRAARFETALLAILDRSARDGIAIACLKGLHTGHVYFPEPAARAGADIDLLVRPADLERLARVLADLGFVETRRIRHPFEVEWRAGDAPRHVRSLTLDHADNPWAVDVHTSLERFYFRGLRCEIPWSPATSLGTFQVAGRAAAGLRQPLLAAHLALHSSHDLHGLQLIRLVELALVCRRDSASGDLSRTALEAVLTAAGAWRFVYPAFALTAHLAPGSIPAELVERAAAAASARARRVVAAMAASGAYTVPHRTLEEKLMWPRGLREVALNISEWLWPSAGGPPRPGRWRLLARRLHMLLTRLAGVRVRDETRVS